MKETEVTGLENEAEIKRLIENQKYPFEAEASLKFIANEAKKTDNLMWAVIGAYHYGVMIGKRKERSQKSK